MLRAVAGALPFVPRPLPAPRELNAVQLAAATAIMRL